MNSFMQRMAKRTYFQGVLLIIAFAAVLFVGLQGAWSLQLRWIVIIVVSLLVISSVGWVHSSRTQKVNGKETEFPGRWDGAFIDPRRKISLSRFQIILWTVVALSAWTALVLDRTYVVGQFVDIDDWMKAMLTVSEMDNRELSLALVESENVDAFADTQTDVDQESVGEAETESPDPANAGEGADIGESMDAADEGQEAVDVAESDEPESSDLADAGEGADTGGAIGTANELSTANDLELPEEGYSPLNVRFPQELLLAMGIGMASLAGASLIKSSKSTRQSGRATTQRDEELVNAKKELLEAQAAANPLREAFDEALNRYTQNPTDTTLKQAFDDCKSQYEMSDEKKRADDLKKRIEELEESKNQSVGQIHTNDNVEKARWTDMFNGESISDYLFTDISKVQMFFITILIVFSYAALIWVAMGNPAAQALIRTQAEITLPEFSESLIVLLGISHAGYLVVKSTE